MEILHQIGLFLQTAIQTGTPILFAIVGGILCEKVGHMNLGVEGMMLMGASLGFAVACATGNPLLAMLAAGAAGAAGALIYAFITVTLRGNQVVTGLVLTIFGTGVSGLIGGWVSSELIPQSISSAFRPVEIPLLSKIPVLGEAVFSQDIYVWLGLVIAVIAYFYLNKTKLGLYVRAIGENPGAADASGINVTLHKYINILLGGFLCGLGGAYLSTAFLTTWQDNVTAGAGWIAVALIIFSTWNPLKAIFAAYLFGMLRGLNYKMQGWEIQIPSQFLTMLPYVATVIVLIFIAMRKKKENQPPKALGEAYFREER